MRKPLLLLVLSIFFIQCSKNDEDVRGEEEQGQIEDLTISITIEGNLLDETWERILYVSNEEGVIKGQISLLNNQENLLIIPREPNTQYNAIIYDKLTYDVWTRHDFSIYANVKSSEYTLNATSIKNPGLSNDLPNVKLNLTNTGSLTPIGMTLNGRSTYNTANGGFFESNGHPLTKPGNYYVSFRKENEPFARYFWTENVEEDISFSLNYEELLSAPGIETQLPENELATVFVHDYKTEHPLADHLLTWGNTQGIPVFKSYIPEEEVFDYFIFSGSVHNGNTSHSFWSVSEDIPSSIQTPSFDLAINNFSVDNTHFTTTGNYDVSNATFLFSDNNANTNVIVKVFAEQNSRVSFSIGTLLNSLYEELPTLDPAQLEPYNITLSSYNYHENYEEAIKGIIEVINPQAPGNFREAISHKVN